MGRQRRWPAGGRLSSRWNSPQKGELQEESNQSCTEGLIFQRNRLPHSDHCWFLNRPLQRAGA